MACPYWFSNIWACSNVINNASFLVNGQRVKLADTEDLNNDGVLEEIEEIKEVKQTNPFVPMQMQPTEKRDVMREINHSEIDQHGFYTMDTRSRLTMDKILLTVRLNELSEKGFIPDLKPMIRQTLRLVVSAKGEGRKELTKLGGAGANVKMEKKHFWSKEREVSEEHGTKATNE